MRGQTPYLSNKNQPKVKLTQWPNERFEIFTKFDLSTCHLGRWYRKKR